MPSASTLSARHMQAAASTATASSSVAVDGSSSWRMGPVPPVPGAKPMLNLQVGEVTHAVDDLITGYESLVDTLPNLRSRVSEMHAGTEVLAKQLAERTGSLVADCEYLTDLAAAVPPLLQRAAENHRQALAPHSALLSADEKQELATAEQKLSALRREARSLAHERLVVDVLTRPTLTECQQMVTAGGGSTVNNRNPHTFTNAFTQLRSRNTQPLNQPTAADLDAPIPIPQYQSPFTIRTSRFPPSRQPQHQIPVPSTTPSRGPVTVKPVGDVVVVPNVRVGTLPPDVRALHSSIASPTPVSTRSPPRRRAPSPPKVNSPSPLRGVRFSSPVQETPPPSTSVHQKETIIPQDLERRFAEERKRTQRSLNAILKAAETRSAWRDDAVMAAVDSLVSEAVGAFHGAIDELDALGLVEEILSTVPWPEDYIGNKSEPVAAPNHETANVDDHSADWRVIGVRREPPPVTIVPAPPSHSSEYRVIEHKAPPVNASIQVDLPPEPVVVEVTPTPSEVVDSVVQTDEIEVVPSPPVVPADDRQNTTVIIQREGVERELVDLLRHLVDTQAATLYGQQELMRVLMRDNPEIIQDSPKEAVTTDPEVKPETEITLVEEVKEEPIVVLQETVPEETTVEEIEEEEEENGPVRSNFGANLLGRRYRRLPDKVISPSHNLTPVLGDNLFSHFPEAVSTPSPQESPIVPPSDTLASAVTLLATKLSPPVPQQSPMSRDEISDAISQGVSSAMRQVVRCFNSDDFMTPAKSPTAVINAAIEGNEKYGRRAASFKNMGRDISSLSNAYAGELLNSEVNKAQGVSKVQNDEEDSLSPEKVAAETARSMRVTSRLREEDDSDCGYGDSISLDEGFAVIYGNDLMPEMRRARKQCDEFGAPINPEDPAEILAEMEHTPVNPDIFPSTTSQYTGQKPSKYMASEQKRPRRRDDHSGFMKPLVSNMIDLPVSATVAHGGGRNVLYDYEDDDSIMTDDVLSPSQSVALSDINSLLDEREIENGTHHTRGLLSTNDGPYRLPKSTVTNKEWVSDIAADASAVSEWSAAPEHIKAHYHRARDADEKAKRRSVLRSMSSRWSNSSSDLQNSAINQKADWRYHLSSSSVSQSIDSTSSNGGSTFRPPASRRSKLSRHSLDRSEVNNLQTSSSIAGDSSSDLSSFQESRYKKYSGYGHGMNDSRSSDSVGISINSSIDHFPLRGKYVDGSSDDDSQGGGNLLGDLQLLGVSSSRWRV